MIAAAAFAPDVYWGSKYYIPVKGTGGSTLYASLSSGYFPFKNYYNLQVANTSAYYGIRVGSGTTAPTEDDYNIQSQISFSVIDGSATLYDYGVDSSGNPYTQILLAIKNKGSSPFTVSEICYFGNMDVKSSPNASSGGNQAILVDRTVLDTPVEIPAGETAEILYTIKCAIS